MASRVGVYVCHCGINIAQNVDSEAVARYAAELPGVVVARDYKYMCSDPGQALIQQDVVDLKLDRVVVASCSPLMHEPTFRTVVQEVGMNPYQFEMANIREQCSGVHTNRAAATEKARELVAAAVAKAVLLEELEEREVPVTPAALVIGGGVAGLTAALDLAEAGNAVYVVEREPSVGGRMAQLSRTFPALDEAAALLATRMQAAEEHPNVTLLTNAEVVGLEGYIGAFQVQVRIRPRYVTDRCTACGQCAEACVLTGQIPHAFDLGLSRRGAAYMPFPQAVPQRYVVDADHCLFLTTGQCGEEPACAVACPEGAFDWDQREETVELEVGTVVVATGYDPFDPRRKPELGYPDYPNVVTALEFERMLAPAGPTRGRILVDGREPEDVLFLHCVGSRDKTVGNEYCSRVCCMYSAKQARMVVDALPNARVTVLYMDVRAFTKGGEEFYTTAMRDGVRYRRASPSEIYRRGDRVVVLAEDTLLGQPLKLEADLVVLAVGLEPRPDVQELASLLKLARSPDGFFAEAHPKLRPVDTTSDGIFLAGCCQGPKDIPDTVAQAKAAASSALIPLSQGRAKVEAVTGTIVEELCTGCALCELACVYGALSLHPWKGVMTINEVLCKGCGACSVACPSKAIRLQHFTQDQTLAMIDYLLD
jgi:heterodisulfide reductase subunit A